MTPRRGSLPAWHRPHRTRPALAGIARTPIQPAYLAKPRSQLTVAERAEAGRALRVTAPREAHAAWTPAPDRADPVDLVLAAEAGRIERLLPIRHGRMVASPFAFYRGAAAIMAADLAATPSTGYIVQACGDCHLLNFGAFATPERRVIFDINDFDETFPAPWEWDLKRLATSFVVASRANGHRPAEAKAAAQAVARSYGQHMAELSTRKALDVWYSYLDWEELIDHTEDAVLRRRRSAVLQKAVQRDAAGGVRQAGPLRRRAGEDQGQPAAHLPPGRRRRPRVRGGRRGQPASLPRLAGAGAPRPLRPLRAGGRGDQGGGRRQRRDAVRDRPAVRRGG